MITYNGILERTYNWSNGKGTVHAITGHECPEGEYRYSSTLSLTSTLDGVDGQRHVAAALPPGKTQYSLYRRLGGPQGRSGQVRKISLSPGFDPRTVQPVASCCTDCAIPAHTTYKGDKGYFPFVAKVFANVSLTLVVARLTIGNTCEMLEGKTASGIVAWSF
jgi:hypothetical protein